MMQLHLNFLSPRKHTKLSHLVNFFFLKSTLELLLLAAIVAATILLWGWLIIFQASFSLSRASTLSDPKEQNYNERTRRLNIAIDHIHQASKDFAFTSPHLNQLIAAVPQDVQITALEFRRNNNTFTLSGIAATRAALLHFEKVLRELTFVNEIKLPVSQLLPQTNLTFELTITLQR